MHVQTKETRHLLPVRNNIKLCRSKETEEAGMEVVKVELESKELAITVISKVTRRAILAERIECRLKTVSII
jgi:hypothetical protein